jgi:NADPH-dependent FMN reductase
MHRIAAGLPLGWQIDLEDLGNEHGKPKIQSCNACVSSSMALCVWPCNCYGPHSDHQPDLLWDLDLYARLARADAWAFIGPINWYGPTSNFKLLFDRLVCMNGGNPRPDLIDKKNTLLAQALERSSQWRELSKNHLEGRSAAFFCYGDRGGADLDATGRPKILMHKEWFDPKEEPYDKERNAYQGLVWQCRYSGVEVPDALWSYAEIGVGKLYADTQADSLENEPAALAAFDEWTRHFARHVESKGMVEGADDAARGAKSTTQ